MNSSSKNSPEIEKGLQDTSEIIDRIIYDIDFDRLRSFITPEGEQWSRVDIADTVSRIKFELVDTDFGDNRAGANSIGPDGLITIQINVSQFENYIKMEHDMEYLVFHELAHGSHFGKQTNIKFFEQWYSMTPGATLLNPKDLSDAYAGSFQFQANEAWANNFGRDMARYCGIPVPCQSACEMT